MKTSPFLSALRAHAGLPLIFRTAHAAVAPGYHLTEVKRVAYETMDCGAATHRWTETQFELWVPPAAEHAPGRPAMAAGKFLGIVARVEAGLPLDGEATARIFVGLDGHPAALYDIAGIAARDGQLVIELTPDRARCKAAERRAAADAADAGGCCGVDAAAAVDTGAGCGCEPENAGARAAACCA